MRALELVGNTREAHVLVGEEQGEVWRRFAEVKATSEGDILARLVSTVTDLPLLLSAARQYSEQAGVGLTLRAHLGHGHALLRWHAPDVEAALTLLSKARQEAEAAGANLVVWRAPAEVRARFDVWGDVGEGLLLMHRIKAQFDPQNTLNPGRFVGGI